MAATERLVSEQIAFRGWDAAALANEFVRLVAVPDIGGRIMAYDLGPHPFFFVDPRLAGRLFTAEENQGDGSLAAWKNYGGDKTWPAPQGWDTDAQWHGPPDPVLDTGRYALDELRSDEWEAALRLVSPPDLRTGVQITRRFTLGRGSSRVRVDLAFRNVLPRPIRWSIWDVVQLDAGCTLLHGSRTFDPSCAMTAPLNPVSRFPQGFQVLFGAPDNSQWRTAGALFRADYRYVIGKVAMDSPGGWIAFSQGSQKTAFVVRFTHEPDGDYPDGGATIECWTVGQGQVANLDYTGSGIYLMEAEVLSPLRTMAPGAEARFSLEWAGCCCDGPIVDVQAGGCASQALAAQPADELVRLTGSFGVFDAGVLELAWLDVERRVLAQEALTSVDPLTAVPIDHLAAAPAAAAAVELHVLSREQKTAALLAQSPIAARSP